MPLIAATEYTIAGPIDTVFSRFIDYPQWAAWMPSIFRPMRGPSRPLRTGDRILISLSGLPSFIKVELVDAPREVRWGGGVPGILHASHTFRFEAVDEKTTRILSSEPWTGLVTHVPTIGARIQKTAEAAARGQLKGFERWFLQQYAGFAS
jgi:hypothetical protein